jgi:hypothetical protein
MSGCDCCPAGGWLLLLLLLLLPMLFKGEQLHRRLAQLLKPASLVGTGCWLHQHLLTAQLQCFQSAQP